MKAYKSIDELPACLTVSEVAKLLRISKPIAYQLVHRDGFPAMRLGEKRIVIPKEGLLRWMSRGGMVNNRTAEQGDNAR